ncbi:MAG: DUF5110 domain-containing protein [Duncaniella sp.]|nr:DUF5110 domain-containing protein [Duncaniella sp.]
MRLFPLFPSLIIAASAFSAEATEIDLLTPGGRHVTVTPVTENIIKVANLPKGYTAPKSQTLLLDDQTTEASLTSAGGFQILTTPAGVTARVNATTGAVDITAGANRAISDPGVRTLADGRQSMQLSTMGSGSVYGAGERGHSFNLAGDTLVMYNRQNYGYRAGDPRISQMNITMPLFLSSEGYAVVFDDFAASELVMSNPLVYTTESSAPVIYYFINSAGTLADVTRTLSQLTGRQKLPPFWAMGYITSKYGYHDRSETEGVIDTLKRAGYPVDGVVLDLYWYGKEQDMGRLAWDPEQWPDHSRMLKGLKDKGVNTVIISQPYVLRNGEGKANFDELSAKGLLLKNDSTGETQEVTIWVGEGGMFDMSNPDTRRWLTDRYRDLTLEGVGGWWGDLGEPEVHPESGRHANGLTTREYHNLYGNDWSRIISDLYADSFPDVRLMTMMRGGTTGLQRYSVFPWSTDVSRSWGGMQPQITIMLNSGLSGLGYMSHDVGGFAIDEEMPYDPELYVRWLQLGTFSPVLRTHAQKTAEPYKYPEQQDIILPLIKSRYAWLPYNYTLAYENASQGLPLVRPMNFYSGSSLYDDITDQYLWGRDILVAPVLEQGARERRVIFPEGLWVDFNNPSKIYEGGDTIMAAAPLEVLPLYVRAGAFIPQADYKMDNTGDYRTDRYTINYYPYLGESEYVMFEDDRSNPNSLADGAYQLITFKGDATVGGLDINVSAKGTYPGAPAVKQLTFAIHLFDGKPREVSIDGRQVKKGVWKYDPATSTLTIPVKWTVSSPLEIKVR